MTAPGIGTSLAGTSHGELSRLLDVASGGSDPGSKITCSKITRNADIRSTTRSTMVMISVRIMLSSWEPPIVSAYRNRADGLRITRGPLPCSHSLTCTDSTANRTRSADCTGISGYPFHDPFHGSAIGRRLSSRTLTRPSQDHERPATDRPVPASAIYTWA